MDQAQFPWRPIGTLLADEGLLTEGELEHALLKQAESGRPLGQILVDSGYLSGWTLTRVLAQQHGVDLHTTREIDSSLSGRAAEWRPLGRLLVETEAMPTGDGPGYAIVKVGQRSNGGIREMTAEEGAARVPPAWMPYFAVESTDDSETFEAAVRPTAIGEPVYHVCEIRPSPDQSSAPSLYETTNFLEAADFAFEFVEQHNPHALEIQRTQGDQRESVWTYSEERAASAAASRKDLVETYGFDPIRWNARSQRD